jgi:hypothetical protein
MHQAPDEHIGAAASLNQGLQQLGGGMGLALLTSVLAATGGLANGLGATLLATAAFPLAGLVLFGVWARRIPTSDATHASTPSSHAWPLGRETAPHGLDAQPGQPFLEPARPSRTSTPATSSSPPTPQPARPQPPL